MKLALADPPYLGRSRRWYGDGRGHQGGRGRAAAHAAANEWDDPTTHQQLVAWLEAGYDGWAIAASPDSLATYLPGCPTGVRVLVVPRQVVGRISSCSKVGMAALARPRWTSRGRFQAIAS